MVVDMHDSVKPIMPIVFFLRCLLQLFFQLVNFLQVRPCHISQSGLHIFHHFVCNLERLGGLIQSRFGTRKRGMDLTKASSLFFTSLSKYITFSSREETKPHPFTYFYTNSKSFLTLASSFRIPYFSRRIESNHFCKTINNRLHIGHSVGMVIWKLPLYQSHQ